MYTNKLFIILYSILISFGAVLISFKKKTFLTDYDESIVLLIESLLISIFLSIYVFLFKKNKNILNELAKISYNDWFYMILFPFLMTFAGIIGAKIMKVNDITYLTILDTSLDIILTALLGYYIFNEKLNLKKVIGLILVLIGIILLH
jgi:uncharacterized membrane protein